MIFQEPMTSLNPVFKIGRQISESARYHLKLSKKEAAERAVEMLRKVGIPGRKRLPSSMPISSPAGCGSG